jgi:glycosyltransferase involved in cell wall biosynthesis
MNEPLVSIVIPTYKRFDLLQLAVDSALNQTYPHIEVIVSDDEDPPGASWAYLQRRAADDPRLRPVRNPGAHGQEPNMNNALRQARGAWIKPLHDDDRLLPHCVERFMHYCRARDHIALAGCAMISVAGDKRFEPKLDGLPRAELIRQKYVHLGMYLQDDVVGNPPTALLINRRAVEAGGYMIERDGLRYFADSQWEAEIVRHGDSVLIREPLVEWVQGEHLSLTSEYQGKPEEMDAELHLLRGQLRAAIPPDVPAPPLETVRQMILVLRTLSLLKARRPAAALRRALRVHRPAAWWRALRVILRMRYPTRFHDTPREVLLPVSA